MTNKIIALLDSVPGFSLHFAGAPLSVWLTAILLTLLLGAVFRKVVSTLEQRIERFPTIRDGEVNALLATVLRSTGTFMLLALGALVTVQVVPFPPPLVGNVNLLVVVALCVQLGLWGSKVLAFLVERQLSKTEPGARQTTLDLLLLVGRIFVWVLVLLLILENVGVDVTTLIAGLGIGGIAIALAVQKILGDVLSSLSILLDKPFEVGDAILVGDFTGTVEKVGIKTTRLRSVGGEQLIISNSDLLASRIRNFKRMQERRVLFTIGVTYQTSLDKLQAIPGIIREIIQAQEKVRFDRAHFARYGTSSLDFEVVYFMLSPDYLLYMNTQERVNLGIFKKFSEAGIEFAYPTMAVVGKA